MRNKAKPPLYCFSAFFMLIVLVFAFTNNVQAKESTLLTSLSQALIQENFLKVPVYENYFHPLGISEDIIPLETTGIHGDSRYGVIRYTGKTTFTDSKKGTVEGKPVFAAHSGYITIHALNPDGSYKVKITHLNQTESFYYNLSPDDLNFNHRTPILKGEKIGTVLGDSFSFAVINQNKKAVPSDFQTLQGQFMAESRIGVNNEQVYAFSTARYNHMAQPSPSRHLLRVQVEGDGDPTVPPPPEPISIPGLCELTECPEIPGIEETDFEIGFFGGGTNTELYDDVNEDAWQNAPEALETPYCPAEVRRALDNNAYQKYTNIHEATDSVISNPINFLAYSCYDIFAANLFGPISSIFSSSGGFFNDILGGLTQGLGLIIPEGTTGAALQGLMNGFIGDLVCESEIIPSFTTGGSQLSLLATRFSNQNQLTNSLSNQLTNIVPPEFYMSPTLLNLYLSAE